MPWESSRAVPWRRLIREWALFAALMVIVFGLIAKAPAASYVGLAASFPLYMAFGAILAKFGYSRKTLAELRAERHTAQAATSARQAPTGPRPKPAPTKRTGRGNRQSGNRRR